MRSSALLSPGAQLVEGSIVNGNVTIHTDDIDKHINAELGPIGESSDRDLIKY